MHHAMKSTPDDVTTYSRLSTLSSALLDRDRDTSSVRSTSPTDSHRYPLSRGTQANPLSQNASSLAGSETRDNKEGFKAFPGRANLVKKGRSVLWEGGGDDAGW